MKEGIAIVEVGNINVFCKVLQSNALDHLFLSLGHDIPDIFGSSLSQGYRLTIQSISGMCYSRQLSLKQIQLNVRP